MGGVNLKLELEREDDGRWIAEIPELPGVLGYGSTREEAVALVKSLALHVVADRLSLGEAESSLDMVSFEEAA